MKIPLRFLLLGALLFHAGCGAPSGTDADGFAYFYLDVHRPFFVGTTEYSTRRPLGREPQRFAAVKPADIFRVFIVGGSVAQLYDIGDARPSLREALTAALPGKKIEVINCGMSAYDAARAGLVLNEILDYAPDLVIVMSGANESGRPLLSRTQARLCRMRPLRGACERWVARAAGRRVDRLRDRAAFARTLRAMVHKARARSVPLLLTTLPVALRDMPPRGVLPLEAEPFFTAWTHWERGELKAAAAGFRRYLDADGDVRTFEGDGLANYYLARSLDRLGDIEQARTFYLAAQNNHRPLPLLNDAVRQVAAEEGAPLADLEKAFADAAPQGLPGRELFEDDVHWDRAFDPLATVTIVEALAREHKWEAALPPAQSAAIRRSARAARITAARSWHVFRVRMWEPLRDSRHLFSERVLALLETVHLSIPEAVSDTGRMRSWLERELSGNIWFAGDRAKLDRWWPAMLAHVGEVHRRGGRPERAAAFFDEALRLAPDLHKARLHKALALLGSGRTDAGRSELERIPNWREDPVIMRWRKVYGL
ncbi:MAG: tetratricopeptide repeat protein [Elusimicrobiota bacterium]